MVNTENSGPAPAVASDSVSEVPNWVESYKLPDQLEAELAIAEIEGRLQQLRADLQSGAERLPEAMRFSRLLYEQDGALRSIVMEALELLGGTVPSEAAGGLLDTRVVDPEGRVCLVEVTGSAGSLKGDSIRRLLDREFAAADEDANWRGKAVLIVNPECSQAPADRREQFPESVVRMAVRLGQCVLPSTQLFEAVRQLQIGMFDKVAFWDSLNCTAGVCTLAEPAALASDG